MHGSDRPIHPSTLTVRRLRARIAAALAAACVAGSVAACSDGGLTEAGSATGRAYARLAVTATLTAQLAAQTRTLVVVTTYARAAAPTTLLPLDSTAVGVTVGGGTDVPVQVNITACLADPARQAAPAWATGPACLLHLTLLLLDGRGTVIGEAPIQVSATAGATVSVPNVTFSAPPGDARGNGRGPVRAAGS